MADCLLCLWFRLCLRCPSFHAQRKDAGTQGKNNSSTDTKASLTSLTSLHA